jgi:hypothetical protein
MMEPTGFGVDRWLGIIGAVFGVLGVFAAYYFYRRTIRSKVLSISYSKPVPLLASHPTVKALYNGAAIDALSMSIFLFWNKGSAPIEASDFIEPVKLKSADKVLDIAILDEDFAADAKIDTARKEISVSVLRPNEAIIFRVIEAQEVQTIDLGIVMKSADMSSFLKFNRSNIPLATAFIVAVLSVLFLLSIWTITTYFPSLRGACRASPLPWS